MTDILKVIIGVVLGSFLWELITELRYKRTIKTQGVVLTFSPFERLEVGKIYLTRNGKYVKIVEKIFKPDNYVFLGNNEKCYNPNGRQFVFCETEFDLIKKIS